MKAENKHRQIFTMMAVILAMVGWVSIPMFNRDVKAGGVPILVRTANLTSPTGSINPHGAAEYQLYANGQRELEVEIEDVNLPSGTSLTATINGSSVGQLILDVDGRGRLKLRSEDGQTVPVVNDGNTVNVRNGSTVLVAGVFGGGGPTPSPTASPSGSPSPSPSASPTGSPSPSPSVSPTGSPSPSPSPTGTPNANNLFAALTGSTVNGVLPTGYAEFEVHSSRIELEVRVRQVNLPPGTSLSVFVNNAAAGTFSLESGGEGRLRLRSDNGQNVPAVVAGSTIQIRNGAATILSGIFGGFAGPSPSPSPTGTPGATPSPTPTPTMGRSFEANLTRTGSAANGEFKVTLNALETQATIFGEFHNLASNQTGARIETTTGTPVIVHSFGVVGGNNGNFASVTVNVSAAMVQQLRTGLWSAVITSVGNPGGEITGQFRQRSNSSDFDGDGSNDLAVFRPSTGTWFKLNSSGFSAESLGTSQDRVVSADYDGDGKTDLAIFRALPGGAAWEIKRSSDGGTTSDQFGAANDIPVRGDFDGDGRSDIAVFRPSNGTWYMKSSGAWTYNVIQFGASGDVPLPGDMDGDGKDDIVVFRPSEGKWYWLGTANGGTFNVGQFGVAGDIPVRGDFDGDGKNDMAVFRPSTGTWYSLRTSVGGFQTFQFGVNGDVPVAGDYDNDGKTDIAVFRPSNGNWYIITSGASTFEVRQFGINGDVPTIAQ